MGTTEALQQLIKQRLQPQDEASEALLLLLIRNWLYENEHLFFLNMNANEHANLILKNAINEINKLEKEKDATHKANKEKSIKKIIADEITKNKQLKNIATAVPVDNEKSAKDEVDALLAYVPETPIIIDEKEKQEKNEQNTRTALSHSDAAQNLASFAGGLASASIQESADFAARAATVPDSTLVALRNPLPPSIATGAHIASVVADGLNLIVFPALLLRAYLRGEKISLTKEDVARLAKSAVTLGLGIAGLVVAPAIAIPLMIASSAFAAGTVLIGLGNFLVDRYRLNKEIDANRKQFL